MEKMILKKRQRNFSTFKKWIGNKNSIRLPVSTRKHLKDKKLMFKETFLWTMTNISKTFFKRSDKTRKIRTNWSST